MSVKRFSTSFISESGQDKSSNFIAGYSPAIDEMDLIERVTLSASAASIEFTGIPQTYQHLQIRVLGRTSRTGSAGDFLIVRFNSDSESNYSYHYLTGNGSSVSAAAWTSQTYIAANRLGDASNTDYWGAIIIDILDYASTTKNKTTRALGGNDRNGAGQIDINSGLWMSTNAITSVLLTLDSNRTFAQNSTASLYGVKA